MLCCMGLADVSGFTHIFLNERLSTTGYDLFTFAPFQEVFQVIPKGTENLSVPSLNERVVVIV